MIYLFDTNIVLGYIRQNRVATATASILNLTDDNNILISIVAVGELLSIANQSGWGGLKKKKLQNLLDTYSWIKIDNSALLYRYAEIDTFSQGKSADKPLQTTARNMGKNDLWIAATASLAGASLITTDKDFDHLHNQFLDVIWIDPDQYN